MGQMKIYETRKRAGRKEAEDGEEEEGGFDSMSRKPETDPRPSPSPKSPQSSAQRAARTGQKNVVEAE